MQLNQLIKKATRILINTGKVSNSTMWQGIPNPNPLYQSIKVYLGPAGMPNSIRYLVDETKPNLPWAEDHFQERISGQPLNPGEQYKNWPFYGNDKAMRTEGEKFTHTYMERIWPKFANMQDPVLAQEYDKPNRGVRYRLGDLHDILALLVKDPETRQAYLPIWFPEDTGAVHGGRVPCTLGYLFQIVDGYLHMTYYIRSCDYYRHFRDDIYMAVRMCQHILLSLKTLDAKFRDLQMGMFDMHIGSLHIFNAEVTKLNKEIY